MLTIFFVLLHASGIDSRVNQATQLMHVENFLDNGIEFGILQFT